MATFDQFINSIIADGNDGKAFERFCKHFLETSPEYAHQFDKVWLWDDWPNKWSHDKGIDLVAKYKGRNTYCAVQAKCYAAHNTVPYNEVTNFLADSSRTEIEDRILMMSTNKLNEKTSKEVISGQEKQVTILDRDYFENKVKFDYPSHISELGKAKAKPPATPRKHQITAINDVEKGLQENDRGQLIMACGTGKTFTTLWIKERLKANTVLVLLPSLSLLSQTMREWVWGANERFEALAVCSDPTVGKSKNTDEDISTAEVGKVTWHVDEIQAFLKTPNPKVIFCTYQSSELIQLAQKDETIPQFDLVVCDEAHRCAGKANAGFATVLHEEKIRAKKRLFTTATPRYYGKSVQSAAEGRGVEIIGMDDEAKFGPVVHKLTFGQAIELGKLTDYQVVVVGVDEPMVREWIMEGEIVSYGDQNHTDARTLAAKIAVLKAIKDYDLKRVISFHTNIKRAKEFASDVFDVADIIDPEQRPLGHIWSQHVDGTMSAGKRRDLINGLKELDGYEIGLLTNARCLSEGVDVPTLDGVAFVDPRGSQVDIIQAVGRAIRKSDNKTKGTIVLPVFLETGDDPDTVIDASNFKPVWDVLKALRAHDEVLADELDQYRTSMGLRRQTRSSVSAKILLDLPINLPTHFSHSLTTRLVDATTQSWYFWFGLLENFISEYGHATVPAKYVTNEGFKLGSWCDTQRTRYKSKQLEPDRLSALDELIQHGWEWSLFDAQRRDNIAAIKRYFEREGHTFIQERYVDPDGVRLGAIAKGLRQAYAAGKLEAEYVNFLQTNLKFKWDIGQYWWLEQYKALRRWYHKNPNSSPPREHRVIIKISPQYTEDRNLSQFQQSLITSYKFWELGEKRKSQRTIAPKRLSQKQIKLVENIPNWNWTRAVNTEEKWRSILADYCQTFGAAELTVSTEHQGYAIGRKISKLRSRHRKVPLDQEIIDFLTRLGIDLDPFQTQWMQSYQLLKEYTEENGVASPTQSTVHRDMNLGSWVSTQREAFKNNRLSEEKVRLLSSLRGWIWNASPR
jgi:superfamily II DNA or RNA helicase